MIRHHFLIFLQLLNKNLLLLEQLHVLFPLSKLLVLIFIDLFHLLIVRPFPGASLPDFLYS